MHWVCGREQFLAKSIHFLVLGSLLAPFFFISLILVKRTATSFILQRITSSVFVLLIFSGSTSRCHRNNEFLENFYILFFQVVCTVHSHSVNETHFCSRIVRFLWGQWNSLPRLARHLSLFRKYLETYATLKLSDILIQTPIISSMRHWSNLEKFNQPGKEFCNFVKI